MSRLAVGRLLGPRGEPLGTAFAVRDDSLVTCWHCVSSRADPSAVGYPSVHVAFGPDAVIEARYSDHDPVLDVALLATADPLPPGYRTVPLHADGDAARFTPVDVLGWPTDNPSRYEPQTVPAEIRVQRTSVGDGQPVLRLYSPEVAAGLRPHGFSGGPVVQSTGEPAAIGVLRWMQPAQHDPGVAVGGSVYAVPIGDVLRRWPHLRPTTARDRDPVRTLAGPPGAPGWAVIANFVDRHLRGEHGALPFAGRHAELAALDAWLADPAAPPYHLVTGPAGAGKSTLLARWAVGLAERGDAHIAFVPVSASLEAGAEQHVFGALAHRVAHAYGAVLDRETGAGAARDQTAAFLASSTPDGRPIVVILDALDEATDWQAGAGTLPRLLGGGVRILVSARHTGQLPTPAAWIGRLGIEPGRCATTVLPPLAEDATTELVRQVRGPDATDAAELGRRLYGLTGGEPVVTALYLRDLATTADITLPTAVDEGLAGYLDRWLVEQRRLWDARDAKRVKGALRLLNLLALAEGPLDWAQLRLLLGYVGSTVDSERLRHSLELLDRFVLPGPQPNTVVLAHPLIGQVRTRWLREHGEHERYAAAFTAWGHRVLSELLAGDAPPRSVPPYLIRHLSAHLLPEQPSDRDAVDVPAAFRLVHPAWRRAQDEIAEDLTGYRRDVTRLADYVRAVNGAEVAAGRRPPYLAEQVGCAAALAGERSAMYEWMSPQLAGELVQHGLWRPGRAFAYIANGSGFGGVCARIRRFAPYAPAQLLPALCELLAQQDGMVDTALAPPTEALALRLAALGQYQQAIELASWVPEDYDGDSTRRATPRAVRVRTLATLVPVLPEEQARWALREALHGLFPNNDDMVRAADHLTRVVPYDLMVSLSTVDDSEAELEPVRRLRRVLDTPWHEHWQTLDQFVPVARWLTDSELLEPLRYHLFSRHPAQLDRGLMAALPRSLAPEVADLLEEATDPVTRVGCLLQLLPLLDEGRRDEVAREALAQTYELRHVSFHDIGAICEGVGAGGAADRLLDVIERDGVSHVSYWLDKLAPWLTLAQCERVLAWSPMDDQWSGSRAVVLGQLASFGPEQTARALDFVYRAEEDLPAKLVHALRERLIDVPHRPSFVWKPATTGGTVEHGVPWWTRGLHLGVPWKWRGSLEEYRRPDGGLPPHAEALADLKQQVGVAPYQVVRAAFEAVGGLGADDLAVLREWTVAMADPWAALTILAAGTHIPDPAVVDAVVAALLARLDRLRQWALARTDLELEGVPAERPWLFGSANEWTPFFVRMLHPRCWPAIKPVLFDGGFLDGVLRTHHKFGTHERLDDWAHDVLAYTPILDVAELDRVRELGEKVRSNTMRGWLSTGLATGYAARGQFDVALEMAARVVGGDAARASVAALVETGVAMPPARLGDWLHLVHEKLGMPDDRAAVWAGVLVRRWPELSTRQCWQVLDRWLHDEWLTSRADVLSDLLGYAAAVDRLAGPAELRRILDLIGVPAAE